MHASGRREEVPPILVFRKPEPGVVEFCGLCVPEHMEVRSYQDGTGTQIPNYLFHFSILNTQSICVEWLHERAQTNSDEQAPLTWRQWVTSGASQRWPTGERLDSEGGTVRRYERREVLVSDAFREDTLARYGHACSLTGIEAAPLLELAHVLPRSQHPELAEHPENVLIMNTLHHRAFDANLFTVDSDFRIRASPSFDPGHPFLRETIMDREGERVSLPADARIRPTFLDELNAGLSWL